MTLSGTTVNLAGALDSSSSSAAGGNISITGPAVLSGGNRAVSTGATAANCK
jgi:hypothetical protein